MAASAQLFEPNVPICAMGLEAGSEPSEAVDIVFYLCGVKGKEPGRAVSRKHTKERPLMSLPAGFSRLPHVRLPGEEWPPVRGDFHIAAEQNRRPYSSQFPSFPMLMRELQRPRPKGLVVVRSFDSVPGVVE